MLRKVMMMMRRILHVRGDVMCTVVLLLLLCLLLCCQQLLLSSAWSKPQLKLEIHGSTSSSRTLLGARGARGASGARGPREAQKVPSDPQLPHCKPGPDPDPSSPESRPQTRSRSKSKKKKAVGTKTAKTPPPAPTTPPFDFEGYLREKDKRTFRLLVDQPKKCDLREEEEGGGGRGGGSSSEAAAPYLLIAVKSTAGDFDKRQVVRQTWGKEGVFQSGVSIRTVFLLGTPRNRSALPLWDRFLAYESRTFKDVLVWDFEDTFFNLTLKETHFLDWVNSSCPHVRFVFKGDADVYVNVENILEMLRGRDPEEDLFVGDIIVRAKPIRRRNSKYYVPEFLYGGGLYPDYAGGGGFVMSGHTARRLGPACRQVELFPIDDVFLGMCLQLISVKPSRHQGFRTFGIPRPSAAPHLQTFDPCFYKELMVVHSLSVPQIWLMWNLLRDPKLSCHSRSGPRSGPFRWRTEDDYGDKTVFLRH